MDIIFGSHGDAVIAGLSISDRSIWLIKSNAARRKRFYYIIYARFGKT